MKGIITRVIHVKGFGFLRDEDGCERFLHVGDLVDESLWPSLRIHQWLEFEPTVRLKGGGNRLGVAKVNIV